MAGIWCLIIRCPLVQVVEGHLYARWVLVITVRTKVYIFQVGVRLHNHLHPTIENNSPGAWVSTFPALGWINKWRHYLDNSCVSVLIFVMLENTLENALDSKEIKPVNPKGNQLWIFIGRTDAEAEAPILWPPDVKSWLIGKDPDAEKDWWQEEKGMTEDEMVGWHHRLNGHEFKQAPGDGDGQGNLACCSPCGHKASDMTEWLN